ncbi:hypothetical protein [Puia dinghuensis]|uniref:Small-conductance mechanosensitive channel n=1 Tax=Puia dinghuensis TaxID=1792502 RepID=A0A8J2UIN7_9BACT|nr:hypothetical protein [Puia dinghuensis]GGB23446.1 hypothetical protein GCM10011511_54140 [Puia dinghuensis]
MSTTTLSYVGAHKLTLQQRVLCLIGLLLALLFGPYIAVYFKDGGIPDKFFNFPATTPGDVKPAPTLIMTVGISVLFIATMLLLIVPRLFGFKKPPPIARAAKRKARATLPSWFYIGGIAFAGTVVFTTLHLQRPVWLNDWSLLPLWWGFVLVLDGIVYYRNAGRSLAATATTELIAMGVLSVSGWLLFEYFNFFIRLNWYYPFSGLLHHDKFLIYAVLGSSAFIPMAFEWYQLLCTFPGLAVKYKFGPKVVWPLWVRMTILIVALAGLVASAFYPNDLFFIVWLSPLIILAIGLGMLGIWTPFISIKQRGDWSFLLVFAPTFLFQGFVLEGANWLSVKHLANGEASGFNPAYWHYCIPYVNQMHIFEMPLLGYLGYIPFSVYCWIWFIAMAFLMDIPTTFSLSEEYK